MSFPAILRPRVLLAALALSALAAAQERAHVRRLSDELVRGRVGDVFDSTVSADERWIVYRADATQDERFELYSVPVDGSAPPVKLSFASRPDTDVPAFAFSPDSTRVLFLADTLRNEQNDLYVVAADRSTPPYRLNPPLAAHRTLRDFGCSADGAWVAFRSNHASGAGFELFRVPLDGSAAALRVSAPLVPGGDVRGYRFASPTELVYDADQDSDEVYELYASSIGELRRRAPAPEPTR